MVKKIIKRLVPNRHKHNRTLYIGVIKITWILNLTFKLLKLNKFYQQNLQNDNLLTSTKNYCSPTKLWKNIKPNKTITLDTN